MKAHRIPVGLLLALGSLAVATEPTATETPNPVPSDSSDEPYTYSATTAEDTLPVWNLELAYTGSRSPDSPFRDAWTTQATRAWHSGLWEPSASAGWTNSARGAHDSTLWHLGSGIEWTLSKSLTAGAALDWSPDFHHEDDASVNGGVAGSRKLGKHVVLDGTISGGWDRMDPRQAGCRLEPGNSRGLRRPRIAFLCGESGVVRPMDLPLGLVVHGADLVRGPVAVQSRGSGLPLEPGMETPERHRLFHRSFPLVGRRSPPIHGRTFTAPVGGMDPLDPPDRHTPRLQGRQGDALRLLVGRRRQKPDQVGSIRLGS